MASSSRCITIPIAEWESINSELLQLKRENATLKEGILIVKQENISATRPISPLPAQGRLLTPDGISLNRVRNDFERFKFPISQKLTIEEINEHKGEALWKGGRVNSWRRLVWNLARKDCVIGYELVAKTITELIIRYLDVGLHFIQQDSIILKKVINMIQNIYPNTRLCLNDWMAKRMIQWKMDDYFKSNSLTTRRLLQKKMKLAIEISMEQESNQNSENSQDSEEENSNDSNQTHHTGKRKTKQESIDLEMKVDQEDSENDVFDSEMMDELDGEPL